MSPRKKGDSFYFDRIFPGVGRIQSKAWTLKRTTFETRDRLLLTLYEEAELDILRAIKDGTRTIVEVQHARKKRQLHTLDLTGKTSAPLWATVKSVLATQAKQKTLELDKPCANVTVEGYRKSWWALEKFDVEKLGSSATIASLLDVDWDATEAAWGRSPAHWNQLRRAISRVLTLHLGEHHPTRLEILAKIPRREEIPREPDMTPDLFWEVLARVSPHLRAPIVALAAGGFRKSELQQVRREDLMPHICAVRVRRKVKNKASIRNVRIKKELWDWVEMAIPVSVTMKWLRTKWNEACEAHGIPRVTFHDLRHCAGQWAIDLDADEGDVQKQLGHKTRHQTTIYTARKNRGRAAEATGNALLGTGVPAITPTQQKPSRRHHA